jgi:hypothetical protein
MALIAQYDLTPSDRFYCFRLNASATQTITLHHSSCQHFNLLYLRFGIQARCVDSFSRPLWVDSHSAYPGHPGFSGSGVDGRSTMRASFGWMEALRFDLLQSDPTNVCMRLSGGCSNLAEFLGSSPPAAFNVTFEGVAGACCARQEVASVVSLKLSPAPPVTHNALGPQDRPSFPYGVACDKSRSRPSPFTVALISEQPRPAAGGGAATLCFDFAVNQVARQFPVLRLFWDISRCCIDQSVVAEPVCCSWCV